MDECVARTGDDRKQVVVRLALFPATSVWLFNASVDADRPFARSQRVSDSGR